MDVRTKKIGFASTLVKLFAAAALMVGAVASQQAVAGISKTKHNLSSSGSGNNKTTATDQICVFCHTPHGGDTGAPVPLWNKKLPTSSTFTTYAELKTSTLDGSVLAVGSVSLACLSCHDGSQAMDNMINQPGSGGYSANGSTYDNTTWSGNQTMKGSPIPMLGTDLRNDHPIGVQYCGGGVTGTDSSATVNCVDTDFNTAVKTKSINSQQVFWVDVNNDGIRQKTDLSLYTRNFGGTEGPSVECASCHDPHVESKGSDNVMFMRVTTAGSAICLSCHTK